jgi:DNA-binding response OmpR family regulator
MVQVLIIEDHKPLVRALKQGLEEEGFVVDVAYDGEQGGAKAGGGQFDIILLDLMLPKEDGLSLLKRWREAGLKSHVLILTARHGLDDKVRGLNLGADDYMTKPFALEELIARLRVLMRRGEQCRDDAILRVHDLEIDTGAHSVKRAGNSICVTPREYALLHLLARHQGKVISRSMIWQQLYDQDEQQTSNVVDVFIGHLRNKIDRGYDPPLILTRWGEGYIMRGEN